MYVWAFVQCIAFFFREERVWIVRWYRQNVSQNRFAGSTCTVLPIASMQWLQMKVNLEYSYTFLSYLVEKYFSDPEDKCMVGHTNMSPASKRELLLQGRQFYMHVIFVVNSYMCDILFSQFSTRPLQLRMKWPCLSISIENFSPFLYLSRANYWMASQPQSNV